MQPSNQTKNANTEHDAIAYMAYLIWEKEGRPTGRDQDHWLQAESNWRLSAKKQSPKSAERAASLTFKATSK